MTEWGAGRLFCFVLVHFSGPSANNYLETESEFAHSSSSPLDCSQSAEWIRTEFSYVILSGYLISVFRKTSSATTKGHEESWMYVTYMAAKED